jgi:hypothetical protein
MPNTDPNSDLIFKNLWKNPKKSKTNDNTLFFDWKATKPKIRQKHNYDEESYYQN